MVEKINAADAMLKVLEDWGVKNIYGLPGGSFDSTMNALHNRRNTLHFVQVRHEEVGALAASGEAKVTGKLGVTFGSAGPGAVHLLNGLYDAKYDHVPVLALVG
ncbi:MAG: thiamine pyrophosphate-binding protein, partial [Loigolactobacillus coryniformis]